ncbi:unnamed protein product [Schistosoma turkestanicum]|nr:unnamed protein product [Schistosoma turkestanicum]
MINTIYQTESLQMVDTNNNAQTSYAMNQELTKPLVLFLNSRKEVLSSAPTSPNSSDNEIPGPPISSFKFQPTKDSRKSYRKIITNTTGTTSSSHTNWRKRHGMMTTLHCGPFFHRRTTHHHHQRHPHHQHTSNNGLLFNSPYQSDVSQSAPSSPTIDTYETLPLISNYAPITTTIAGQTTEPPNSKLSTINRSSTQSNVLRTEFQNNHNHTNIDNDYKRIESRSPSCFPASHNSLKYAESTLLCLMQRLGIQSVWPCLLEHGVADVNRLSKLTRNQLIEMGVTDAETRATLMTAAQLLTDSWLNNNSPFHKTWNKSTGKMSNDLLLDNQNVHDSGISSGTDYNTSTCLTYKPQLTTFYHNNGNNSNNSELKSRHEDMTAGKLERTEYQHQSRWGYGQLMPNEEPQESSQMNSYEEINVNIPMIKQNIGSYQTINSDKNSFQNVSKVFGDIQCQSKHPVSILRNSRFTKDNTNQFDMDQVKRSSSTTPKTVKIDERFLSTPSSSTSSSRNEQQQNSSSTPIQPSQISSLPPSSSSSSSSSAAVASTTSTTSVTTNYYVQYPQNSTMNKADPNSVYVQHIYLARYILRKKLNAEHIDLTQLPYSDETGQANIPLRLIQRYSFETNLDLLTVAMALEAERDTNLREIKRPVISFNEEIRSQRFLNCDSIKTGNLQEFLITIGLPMYINHILHYNTTNNKSNNSSQSLLMMTPADLLNMSNGELQEKLHFLPIHIQWLRQEAAVIPWILLLGHMNCTKSSQINNCATNHLYSLPRTVYNNNDSNNNYCRRSSSQLRRAHQCQPAQPTQPQPQQPLKHSTQSNQPINNSCQHSHPHQHPQQHQQQPQCYHHENRQLDHLNNFENLIDKV